MAVLTMPLSLAAAGDSRVCMPVLYKQDGLQAQRNAAVVLFLEAGVVVAEGPMTKLVTPAALSGR